MDLNTIIDDFRNWIDAITHSSWFGTAVTILIIVLASAVISHLSTLLLKKILKSNKGPLPSVSIFINIARVTVWVIGLCIVLSSCFNVNIGAAVTALGIGGIAISLGFQDTLANLIGGLQIIIIGLVEPGDNIQVGNYSGIVHDVTWRHTTIITARGERVVIPNSVISTEALVKLPPETDIKMEIIISTDKDDDINAMIPKMEQAVSEAVSKEAVIVKKPKIRLLGLDHRGYRAQLTFVVEKGKEKAQIVDIAMKAIDTAKHSETT